MCCLSMKSIFSVAFHKWKTFTVPNSSSIVEPLFWEPETPKTLLNNMEKALPQTPKRKEKYRIT